MDDWATAWRQFLSIPTFLITWSLHGRLPPEHPWKQKPLTFDWWWKGATPLALQYGALLWTYGLVIAACGLALLLKRFFP